MNKILCLVALVKSITLNNSEIENFAELRALTETKEDGASQSLALVGQPTGPIDASLGLIIGRWKIELDGDDLVVRDTVTESITPPATEPEKNGVYRF